MLQITIQAFDGEFEVPVVFTVNILPVNDAPVSLEDSYTVPEDSVLSVAYLGGPLYNDSDVDGDLLQIIVIDQPMHGSLEFFEDQSFIYTHDGSETTSDMFTYVANDSEFSSEIAEVQIVIDPINDIPTITFATSLRL